MGLAPDVLAAQRNKLEGNVPALSATLSILVLYENVIKRLLHTRFTNGSEILLQHNALSCHLPLQLSHAAHPNTTLCAVGNQLEQPSPEWLSSFDRPSERVTPTCICSGAERV